MGFIDPEVFSNNCGMPHQQFCLQMTIVYIQVYYMQNPTIYVSTCSIIGGKPIETLILKGAACGKLHLIREK